jgi:hypothetical protein
MFRINPESWPIATGHERHTQQRERGGEDFQGKKEVHDELSEA